MTESLEKRLRFLKRNLYLQEDPSTFLHEIEEIETTLSSKVEKELTLDDLNLSPTLFSETLPEYLTRFCFTNAPLFLKNNPDAIEDVKIRREKATQFAFESNKTLSKDLLERTILYFIEEVERVRGESFRRWPLYTFCGDKWHSEPKKKSGERSEVY